MGKDGAATSAWKEIKSGCLDWQVNIKDLTWTQFFLQLAFVCLAMSAIMWFICFAGRMDDWDPTAYRPIVTVFGKPAVVLEDIYFVALGIVLIVSSFLAARFLPSVHEHYSDDDKA